MFYIERSGLLYSTVTGIFVTFHVLFLIAWLAGGDSLVCYIVMMGRQIARMLYTFSLWGSLFLMRDSDTGIGPSLLSWRLGTAHMWVSSYCFKHFLLHRDIHILIQPFSCYRLCKYRLFPRKGSAAKRFRLSFLLKDHLNNSWWRYFPGDIGDETIVRLPEIMFLSLFFVNYL